VSIKIEGTKMSNTRLEIFKRICKRFPSDAYKAIDNNRLAVYAIKTLQLERIPVTQEAVAVTLFLFFPEKFSLIGFEQYPDSERAHRTLLQLGPKWRNWAPGNTHTGYSLNENGELVFTQVDQALKNPSKLAGGLRLRTPKRPRTRDLNQEIREIEETTLFKEYVKGKRENFTEFAIWELLKSYPYAPKEALRDRVETMFECARLADRKDVIDFLKWVKAEFAKILT
jgi:hypothetical protein